MPINDKDKDNDEIDFVDDWLDVTDYELKLLVLTSILAENNLAYRGSLQDIRQWLGVKATPNTNSRIKAALNSLQDREYIFFKQDGNIYTVTISQKAMKDKQITKIRKSWINAFRRYNRDVNGEKIDRSISIDWIKILKVFVYLYGRNPYELTTQKDIANDLNISESTVSNAIRALSKTNLYGIKLYKNLVNDKINIKGNSCYYCLGTEIGYYLNFEDQEK